MKITRSITTIRRTTRRHFSHTAYNRASWIPYATFF